MNYIEFLEESFKLLKRKQKGLYEKYDIDSYANWYYDQATGLITFSSESKEINFRYYSVGTYSKKTNTWKWSWDNEHTLNKVKERLEEVKSFGEENGFSKLTKGCFESEMEEGWDFTSISCKLLNGIGAYRPETEDLYIFMILYEFVEEEDAKEEKDKFVNCNEHQRGRRAFICQHLKKNSKLGFEEAFDTFEGMEFEFKDDDFQAWCDECERVRIKTDGWNEESMAFTSIKLVCEKCYFEIKESNIK